MDATIRRRLKWVRVYAAIGDAGVACRRCGISRPTLRLWVRRYRMDGEAGLAGLSRRPARSPRRKVFAAHREQILSLRRDRNLGARRIQSELRLLHDFELSITSVQKVLTAGRVPPLRKARRLHAPKRYSRPIPGERVQMDTMKIVPGVYQYTAVDDCSRFRVLGVYKRATGSNTQDFLARVVEEMPFPIQRIQTDRGGEFFSEGVQNWLTKNTIKFRPIPPRSPHLNGKVERSQMTDLQEFWSRHHPRDPGIGQRIEEWQFDYNWRRPHGSLGGKRPVDRLSELTDRTPLSAEVAQAYDPTRERVQHRNYSVDRTLRAIWEAQQSTARASAAVAAADRAVARPPSEADRPRTRESRLK
jgi:transposase InsO family protein